MRNDPRGKILLAVGGLGVGIGIATGTAGLIAWITHSTNPFMAMKQDRSFWRFLPEVIRQFNKTDFGIASTAAEYNRPPTDAASQFRWGSYPDDKGHQVQIEAGINAAGFRGREYSLGKGVGVKRIVAVGDSHTFGFDLRDGQTFCAKLERLLNGHDTHPTIEVLNMGAPGLNLREKFEVLRAKAIHYSPDVVILQYDQDDKYPAPYRQWEQKTLDALVREHRLGALDHPALLSLFNEIRQRLIDKLGWNALLKTMIDEPLTDIIETCKSCNIKLIVIGTWPDREEAMIKRLLARDGIPYLNVNQDIFKGQRFPISQYEAHFNERGHELIAQNLDTIVFPMLQDDRADPR